MTTTEDETNWLPFTLRRKPACTWARVIEVGEREAMIGAGRALPQSGFSALQPGRSSQANTMKLRDQKEAGRFTFSP
jgi:hypothetical protein